MPRPDLPPLRFVAATPRARGASILPAALTPGANRDGSTPPAIDAFLGNLRVDAV